MAEKRRVLVVDDEPGILRFVKIGLTSAGYDVTTTNNGEEALRIVRAQEPDIILLDLLMAPMSGFDVMKELRTFSQVPVLVFTARNLSEDQLPMSNANGLISKPFQPKELLKKIESTLERGNQ